MSLPLPPGALNRVPAIRAALSSLDSSFESHPSFAKQKDELKGKLFFLHDFASRTLQQFDAILNNAPPPDTPATRQTIPNQPFHNLTEKKKDELKEDAVGRCLMLTMMMDDQAGMMFAAMFGGDRTDIGEEVKAKAKELQDVIEGRSDAS